MTLPANEDTQALMRSLLEVIQRSKLHRSCLTCVHFRESSEDCVLAEPWQRPPARVIVNGCEGWAEDIPF